MLALCNVGVALLLRDTFVMVCVGEFTGERQLYFQSPLGWPFWCIRLSLFYLPLQELAQNAFGRQPQSFILSDYKRLAENWVFILFAESDLWDFIGAVNECYLFVILDTNFLWSLKHLRSSSCFWCFVCSIKDKNILILSVTNCELLQQKVAGLPSWCKLGTWKLARATVSVLYFEYFPRVLAAILKF